MASGVRAGEMLEDEEKTRKIQRTKASLPQPGFVSPAGATRLSALKSSTYSSYRRQHHGVRRLPSNSGTGGGDWAKICTYY